MDTYTKAELKALETLEQSWSGDYLKYADENVKVWLTHPDNVAYDGDYQIEILDWNGVWKRQIFYFNGLSF